MTITLPPLRERKEDLPALVRHFLRAAGRDDIEASFGFLLGMCDYDWPLNVRECAAAVKRAVSMADGPVLHVQHLPPVIQANVATYGTRATESVSGDERGAGMPTADDLRKLLALHAGNIAAVARELGKDRAQVNRLIRRHAIAPDDYRSRR